MSEAAWRDTKRFNPKGSRLWLESPGTASHPVNKCLHSP